MIQQKGNISTRSNSIQKPDIEYLIKYHNENHHFPLFQQVLIETRTDCNNHCPFCPHAFVKKELGIMTWECYTAIIKQLCIINFNGRVALMLSNEPLLDERLEEMIRYAKSKSQRLFLDITTNGKLLSVEKIDKLFTLGLDNININDYRGDREQFPNKLSPNIESIFEAYGNNPKIGLYKRRTDESLPNYAGNIPQQYDKASFGFCNYPFRKLTISYNGDILLCCDDFMYETNFGNVLTESLIDCWNKPKLNTIRLALLHGERIDLCSKCNDHQDYNTF